MELFTGSAVALVTPFKDGKVDFSTLERLLAFQLESGTSALVILGTTGEPATMSQDEKDQVVTFTEKFVGGRLPVIVGCGSNSTAAAAENAARYEKLGADGLLVVTPYYNKCTQRGLVEHYRTVCDATKLPVIAYNVPSRTGVNLDPNTAVKLCDIPNLSGIKEASGNIDNIMKLSALVGERLSLYIGDDNLTTIAYSLGYKGVISVAANVLPKTISRLCTLAESGDFTTARKLQFKLLPFIGALFCEVNPIPVKKAMEFIGLPCGLPRLPLTEMEPQHAEILKKTLSELKAEGVIND